MASGSDVDEIAKLSANWDGYGGSTFTPEVVDHARRLVAALEAAGFEVDVTPNPNGTISLEWDNAYYLECGKTRGVGYVKID